MSNTMAMDDSVVKVGKSWGWVMFFGIVSLILGVVIALHPSHSVTLVAILLAIWLLFAGIFRIVVAIADHDDSAGGRWLIAGLGIVSILFGVLIFRHTQQTVAALSVVLGLYWLLAGLIDFFAAFVAHDLPGRGIRIFASLVSIVLGVVALVHVGFSLNLIAVLFGIWVAVFGVIQIILAFQVRALEK